MFCCYSKCTARNHQYIRLKVAATKVFFGFFPTKSEQTAIQQSHIINPLLTSFAWSVRESIAFGFYRTDLAPSSLGLYENLRQYFPVQTSHSVNKSLKVVDPMMQTWEYYIQRYVTHHKISPCVYTISLCLNT